MTNVPDDCAPREPIFAPGLRPASPPGHLRSPLTARERDVLAAARGGETIAALAGRLHLSGGTVRNYLSSAMRKLDARTRAEAVRTAEEKGWL